MLPRCTGFAYSLLCCTTCLAKFQMTESAVTKSCELLHFPYFACNCTNADVLPPGLPLSSRTQEIIVHTETSENPYAIQRAAFNDILHGILSLLGPWIHMHHNAGTPNDKRGGAMAHCAEIQVSKFQISNRNKDCLSPHNVHTSAL